MLFIAHSILVLDPVVPECLQSWWNWIINQTINIAANLKCVLPRLYHCQTPWNPPKQTQQPSSPQGPTPHPSTSDKQWVHYLCRCTMELMCLHTLTVGPLSTSLPNQYTTKCLPALQTQQHSQLLNQSSWKCVWFGYVMAFMTRVFLATQRP